VKVLCNLRYSLGSSFRGLTENAGLENYKSNIGYSTAGKTTGPDANLSVLSLFLPVNNLTVIMFLCLASKLVHCSIHLLYCANYLNLPIYETDALLFIFRSIFHLVFI